VKLLIAIPALNEAEAIDDIIVRSLAARDVIIANSPVSEVAITVVSDGSTDETVERARRYTPQIELIVFPENKGYGEAIKEAWRRSDADLLGFLDADGTCDPAFFAPLCAELVGKDADVAVGCRMNPESRMPVTRRIGNTVFASLLTYLSATGVRDVASGMRVVRRTSLSKLMPLPDGLHFTPAMTARVLLGGELRLVEIDMPYLERTGQSKLKIFRDGVRFFRIIGSTAFLHRPARVLWSAAAIFAAAALALVSVPALYFVRHAAVQDWMLYRCAAAAMLTIAAELCLGGGYLANRMVDLAMAQRAESVVRGRARLFIAHRAFLAIPAVLLLGSLVLAWPSLREYVSAGHVNAHWSRVITISTLVTSALVLLMVKILDASISLVQQRVSYLLEEERGAADDLRVRVVDVVS
jgi:glycosyltransferase involved in cell wall biosynthesis